MRKKFLLVMISLLLLVSLTGCGKNNNNIKLKDGNKVKITYNAAKKVELEEYDNGLVKLLIPKGWKVDVPPVDYIHYSFKVYNPNNKNYLI